MDYIVDMNGVNVEYQLKKGAILAVNDVSLKIMKGKMTALVGESGSGKTTLATTILNCLTPPGKLVGGEITFMNNGEPIRIDKLSEGQLNKFRWEKVSMVFQAAQSSLNPVMTVRDSFLETYHAHFPKAKKEDIIKKASELLAYVKLDVNRVLASFPHELSGGMKQRVMIAFSLLLDPDFVILDEPTTALDVITQDYIFRILKEINREMGVTMLLMTHDINVVGKFSDYVGVMYAGRIMEYGATQEVFTRHIHPYTEGLIRATPSLKRELSRMQSIPGNPPNMRMLTQGCPFAERCAWRIDDCEKELPDWEQYSEESGCRCIRMRERAEGRKE